MSSSLISLSASDIDLHSAVIADPAGSNSAWYEIVVRIRPAIRKGLIGLHGACREDAESFALLETFRALPAVDPQEIAKYSLSRWARRVAARAGRRDATRERYKGIDDKKVVLARKLTSEVSRGCSFEEAAQIIGVSLQAARAAFTAVNGYETAFGEEAFLNEATPAADAVAADGLAFVARIVADLVGADHRDYVSLLVLTGASEIGTSFDKAHETLGTDFRDVENLRKRLRRTLAARFPEAAPEHLAAVTAAYLRGDVAA